MPCVQLHLNRYPPLTKSLGVPYEPDPNDIFATCFDDAWTQRTRSGPFIFNVHYAWCKRTWFVHNEEFCVQWANAQLEAGTTAICFFDPVSSTTITTKEMYLKTGFDIVKRTIARIKGPTATHMASGRCLPIVENIAQTGTAIVGVSGQEDLVSLKDACQNKLTILGNLNGIEMRRWSVEKAEEEVKKAILQAGIGGGFILSDNHGEIPWQVPDEVLMAISEAANKWGHYPLAWTSEKNKK